MVIIIIIIIIKIITIITMSKLLHMQNRLTNHTSAVTTSLQNRPTLTHSIKSLTHSLTNKIHGEKIFLRRELRSSGLLRNV